MAPSFTASGITFVSAGYRLAPQHIFPAGLEDCERALDWVRKEISDSVFIGGHSAGGHYAALIAATQGADLVQGCLPISGVYELYQASENMTLGC
jgi:acetyl esterase/lipase